MNVLNLGHVFSQDQRNKLTDLGAGQIVEVQLHLDPGESPDEIIEAAYLAAAKEFGFANDIGDNDDWGEVVVNLPGFALLAATAVIFHAGISGGVKPSLVEMRKQAGPPPVTFEIAGITDTLSDASVAGKYASAANNRGGFEAKRRSERADEARFAKLDRGRRKADSLASAIGGAFDSPESSGAVWHKPGAQAPDGPDDE